MSMQKGTVVIYGRKVVILFHKWVEKNMGRSF